MSSQGNAAGSPSNRFTVRELKEAQALLQRRKDYLSRFFREQGVAAVRMVDNFVRETDTHYPVPAETLPRPKLEIQFLNPLYVDAQEMQAGARVALMERYIGSTAYIYRLTQVPYAKLGDNWHAEFVEELEVNLRR